MNEIFQWITIALLVVTHYKKLDKAIPALRKGVSALDSVLSWLSGIKEDQKKGETND